MNKNKGSTTGRTQKTKKCVKQIVVTDQFKRMMQDALEATKEVLISRKQDLEKWGSEQKKDFYDVFGIDGNSMFVHRYQSLDLNTGKTITETDESTAREFMLKAVKRMIVICNALYVSEQSVLVAGETEETFKYGSFVNRTYTKKFSAFVVHDRTWNILPEKYKNHLEVNIGQNFVCKEMFGASSKVSTMCHEISHFDRFGYTGEHGCWGGTGTRDLPDTTSSDSSDSSDSSEEDYVSYARTLKNNHDPLIFTNAYNFEKYFEKIIR